MVCFEGAYSPCSLCFFFLFQTSARCVFRVFLSCLPVNSLANLFFRRRAWQHLAVVEVSLLNSRQWEVSAAAHFYLSRTHWKVMHDGNISCFRTNRVGSTCHDRVNLVSFKFRTSQINVNLKVFIRYFSPVRTIENASPPPQVCRKVKISIIISSLCKGKSTQVYRCYFLRT